MVQPKYSPEEALQRAKLMMKYDTSKTLNENKEIISEQDTLAKTGIATGAAAVTGAGIGAGIGAKGLAAMGAASSTAVGGGAMAVGTALGGKTAAAALTIGGGVIAGAAALALTPLIVWYMDKDNAKAKVERIIQYCTTDKSKIDKLERGISDAEVRNLSDQLYDAMKGVGTDEESVYGAFKSLKTASDFCALVTRFNKDYGSEGDLLEFLDDDFDQTSEWMQIFRPLRDIVEDSLLSIKDEGEKKEEGGKKEGGSKVGGGYKSCSGAYSKGCQAEAIKTVQGCLGLVQDGKFGPKTEAALKAKGFSSFTDAEVDKICNKTTTTPVNPDEEDVDGVDPNQI
jgi:hypothetical protein